MTLEVGIQPDSHNGDISILIELSTTPLCFFTLSHTDKLSRVQVHQFGQLGSEQAANCVFFHSTGRTIL